MSLPSDPTVPPLQLVTRPLCHLCEAARAVVEQAARRHGLAWQEVDLEQLPPSAERTRWETEVPVLLIDGRQRDFWQIDPQRLDRLLRERAR